MIQSWRKLSKVITGLFGSFIIGLATRVVDSDVFDSMLLI